MLWRYIFHPYTRYRASYLLGKGLLWFSLWLIVLGSYHSIYVGLNLLEVLGVSFEQFWIIGYGALALVAGVAIWLWVRSREPFSDYLEGHFDLGFRWYNAIAATGGGGGWDVASAKARELLGPVRLWRHFWNEYKTVWLGALGFILVLLCGHGIWATETKRFVSNVKEVWRAVQYEYELTYAERINANTDWRFGYSGDYDTAAVYLDEEEVFTIKSGESGVIEALENSFEAEVILGKGRVRESKFITVVVTQPPGLQEIALDLEHLPTGKKLAVTGIRRILIDQPSLVTGRLGYRPNDALASVNVMLVREEGEDVTRRVVAAELTGKEGHEVIFSTIIRASGRLEIRTTNVTRQESVLDEIVFIVRENLPPTITIETPPAALRIFTLADLPVALTAQDDIALAKLSLFMEARARDGAVLWKRELMYPSALIKGKTLHSASMVLPLVEKRSPTGTLFFYWAQVYDYAGLMSQTPQHVVAYSPKSDFFKENTEESKVLEEAIELGGESISNLAKEYERLEILSEKREVEIKDLRRFQENALGLRESLQEKEAAFSALEEKLKRQDVLSPGLRDKLHKLRKSLQEMDTGFLQNLTQESQRILDKFESELSPQELEKEISRLDVSELERRIEQTLEMLNDLRVFQELHNLKELADNLYDRFRDLEGYMVYEELSDGDINNEGEELRLELTYMAEQFEELGLLLPEEDLVQSLRGGVEAELTEAKRKAFSALAKHRGAPQFLAERSDNLSRLRHSLGQLTQAVTQEEWEAAFAELNYQIFTIGEKNLGISSIFSGERYPKRLLQDMFLRELLSEYASGEKGLLRRLGDNLETVGSSFWELDVFNIYRDGVSEMGRIQRAIDPAAQLRQTQKFRAVDEFSKILTINHEIVGMLLTLKEQLILERERQKQENTLTSAMNNQNSLNRRLEKWMQQQGKQQQGQQQGQQAELSQQEEAYLRSLLAEQAYIRELLEQALRGEQQGQSGENGQQGQSGENGQQGQNGENGKQGQNGENGKQGQNGENGKQGQNGQQGKNGKNGKQGQNGEKGIGGRLGNDAGGLFGKNSLEQLVTRMRELEEELIKRNPDLARVRVLKELIENNLLRHSQGLAREEQGEDPKDEERLAEREFRAYEVQSAEPLRERDLHRLEERLAELAKRDVYPEEYRYKIEVFLKNLWQFSVP